MRDLHKDPSQKIEINQIELSEEEAYQLAEELKSQLGKGQIPDSDAHRIKLMIAGLGDKRGLLRRTFAESLGAVGKVATPELQKALLHNSNVIVRRAAAKTLKLVGDPIALPTLLDALVNDPDLVVQCSAAGAMAIFGEEAVELLLEVLINPDSTAMQCGLASWGLAFVGAKAPSALIKAAQSGHVEIRAAAIAALGEQIHSLKDKSARSLVLKALNDHSCLVRIEATTLLAQLNEPNLATDLLMKKLDDTDPHVRKKAALGLMQLNAERALKKLICKMSEEEDREVSDIIEHAITVIKKRNRE